MGSACGTNNNAPVRNPIPHSQQNSNYDSMMEGNSEFDNQSMQNQNPQHLGKNTQQMPQQSNHPLASRNESQIPKQQTVPINKPTRRNKFDVTAIRSDQESLYDDYDEYQANKRSQKSLPPSDFQQPPQSTLEQPPQQYAQQQPFQQYAQQQPLNQPSTNQVPNNTAPFNQQPQANPNYTQSAENSEYDEVSSYYDDDAQSEVMQPQGIPNSQPQAQMNQPFLQKSIPNMPNSVLPNKHVETMGRDPIHLPNQQSLVAQQPEEDSDSPDTLTQSRQSLEIIPQQQQHLMDQKSPTNHSVQNKNPYYPTPQTNNSPQSLQNFDQGQQPQFHNPNMIESPSSKQANSKVNPNSQIRFGQNGSMVKSLDANSIAQQPNQRFPGMINSLGGPHPNIVPHPKVQPTKNEMLKPSLPDVELRASRDKPLEPKLDSWKSNPTTNPTDVLFHNFQKKEPLLQLSDKPSDNEKPAPDNRNSSDISIEPYEPYSSVKKELNYPNNGTGPGTLPKRQASDKFLPITSSILAKQNSPKFSKVPEDSSILAKPLHIRPEESKSNIYPFYDVGDDKEAPLGQKSMQDQNYKPFFEPIAHTTVESFSPIQKNTKAKLDPTQMAQNPSVMASIPKMQNFGMPTSYTPVRQEFSRASQPGDINWNHSANWEPVVIRQNERRTHAPKQDQTLFESFDKTVRDGFDFGEKEEKVDLVVPKYQIEQTKQDFLQEIEILEKDPHFMKISVAFLKDGPDGIGRRVYCFHVRKMIGTILDLKNIIQSDFGYSTKQQRLYWHYKELSNDQIIHNIKDYNLEEPLLFVPFGQPINAPNIHLRQRVSEICIEDVAQSNCSNVTKEDFQNFASDDNIIWPPYRNWVQEAEELFSKIRNHKNLVENNRNTIETMEMSNLMNLESELKTLIDDFELTATKCVHMIVQVRTEPTYLGNLHGKGGNKYIAGGLVIRECRNWIYCAENVGEGDLAYKLADNELRSLNLLRGCFPDIAAPINCIVDYFGVRFYAEALCPISQKTLIYGSSSEALHILNDKEGEKAAKIIASRISSKKHLTYERVEKIGRDLYTPFDFEMHRTPNGSLYILNGCRLMPSDYFEVEDPLEGALRLFRPELIQNYSDGDMDNEYTLLTWKNPAPCSECNKFINDYEYYYFEKRSLDKKQTLLRQYWCCMNCYSFLAPLERLKIPANKAVKKTVPEKDRLTHYKNMETGEITEDFPTRKVLLNRDCHLMFPEFNKSEDISFLDHEYREDRNQVKKLSVSLQGPLLKKYLEELKNLREEPRTSQELTSSMHKHGINMRLLGRVAIEATFNFHRELAVREIVARSIKVLIRDGLSFLKDEPNGFSVEDVKKCVLYYYNEIFTKEGRQSSVSIWESLTELIKKKYNISIERDVLDRINVIGLILSISKKLNIQLSRVKGYDFELAEPFSAPDFMSISPMIKIKNDYKASIEIALRRARRKDMEGRRSKWFMVGGPERTEATEIYRQAATMAEQIYGIESRQTALVHKEFAKHLESRHIEKGRPEYSLWNRAATVPEDQFSADAKYYYNSAIHALQSVEGEYEPEISDCLIALAMLYKEKKVVINANEAELGDPADVYKYLRMAIEIMEFCVGVDHPDTAELYTKLSLAYKDKGKIAEAYPWIKRAYCIFERIFGVNDEITIKSYDYVIATGLFLDPKIDKIPIEDMRDYLENEEFD